MKVEDVITLDNDAKYLLLDELDYKDEKYFYAVGVYDNQEFDYDDYLFFKVGVDQEGEYVEKVDEGPIYRDLLTIIVADSATDGDDALRDALLESLEKLDANLG